MADPLIPTCYSNGTGFIPAGASPTGLPPPQLAILDWFFPGFSVFAGAVQKYLHIDLNLYIPLLLFAGVLLVCWNYASKYLWDQVESHFMSVVEIKPNDEIYNIIMSWVASQRFSQGARRFVANTVLSSRSMDLWNLRSEMEDEEEFPHGFTERRKQQKGLYYTPSVGSHHFWYRGRLLLFSRRTVSQENGSVAVPMSEREEISLSCFGRNPWILKQLLLEARDIYSAKDEGETQIYRGTAKAFYGEPSWQRCMSRAPRPFSTVILDQKTKQELVDDVADYLNPATQRWYANRGIPYRRGYLLYGPPGTGKSSLSLALAGSFKLRIYMVSLSSVITEEVLGNLFASLPRRCVVLLEDIDAAGLTHTRKENRGPDKHNQENNQEDDNIMNNGVRTSQISLSGLLNVLDGVASQEGRILIMTTNHIENLDKALIRPGRVDMMVKFRLADNYMIASIFQNIFASFVEDDDPKAERYLKLSSEERKAAMDKAAEDREVHSAKIDRLAKAFAAKIPDQEFSPAEIQGHLMRHKNNPQRAIDTAEEFVEKTRKDHEEKERKEAAEKRKAQEEEAAASTKNTEKDKTSQKETLATSVP